MLECEELLIDPWLPTNAMRQRRVIRSRTPEALVGHAERHWRLSLPFIGRRWRPVIRLFETEDAALICTAAAGLLGAWNVRDSENREIGGGHPVGVRSSPGGEWHIKDARGGMIEARYDKRGTCRFVDPTGCELASTRRDHVRTVMEFYDLTRVDPFVRMLLLMAVILER